MAQIKRRYWRRSSRWRAALARTTPGQLSHWHLQILAENGNPLGGHARMDRLMHCECVAFATKLEVQMSKPSPWLKLIDPDSIPRVNAQYVKYIDALYDRAKHNSTKFPAGMGDVISSLMIERAIA
jgi:hypothetical protein